MPFAVKQEIKSNFSSDSSPVEEVAKKRPLSGVATVVPEASSPSKKRKIGSDSSPDPSCEEESPAKKSLLKKASVAASVRRKAVAELMK